MSRVKESLTSVVAYFQYLAAVIQRKQPTTVAKVIVIGLRKLFVFATKTLLWLLFYAFVMFLAPMIAPVLFFRLDFDEEENTEKGLFLVTLILTVVFLSLVFALSHQGDFQYGFYSDIFVATRNYLDNNVIAFYVTNAFFYALINFTILGFFLVLFRSYEWEKKLKSKE